MSRILKESDIHRFYILYDPAEPWHVRYVGITVTSLRNRVTNHIYDATKHLHSNDGKNDWINEILSSGRSPGIAQIDERSGSIKEIHIKESQWIWNYHKLGHKLLNLDHCPTYNPFWTTLVGVPDDMFDMDVFRTAGRAIGTAQYINSKVFWPYQENGLFKLRAMGTRTHYSDECADRLHNIIQSGVLSTTLCGNIISKLYSEQPRWPIAVYHSDIVAEDQDLYELLMHEQED